MTGKGNNVVVPPESKDTSSEDSSAEDDAVVRNQMSITSTGRRSSKYIWQDVPQNESEKQPPVWVGRLLQDEEINTPINYFRYFFSDSILDYFVEQSNLYSTLENPNKPLNLSRTELEQFFGICMTISIFGLPRNRMYWNQNTRVDMVANVISRDRWEEIKSSLHCVDNGQQLAQTDPNRDKLFKTKPFIDDLKGKFQYIPKEQHLCVDEQIVPFKGMCSLKQYNPKSTNIEPDFGLSDIDASSKIVLRLVECIPKNQNFLLFFGNWFSSLPLFTVLADMGIGTLGTITRNRFPGLQVPLGVEMKKTGRGSTIEKATDVDGVEVRVIKWYDNRGVTLASSFDSAQPMSTVNWLLYRRNCHIQNFPKKLIVHLLQFKTDVAAALCAQGKDSSEKKRSKTSSNNVQEGYESKNCGVLQNQFRNLTFDEMALHISLLLWMRDNTADFLGALELQQSGVQNAVSISG
ncbi:hypothetical protein PR048_021477 [Dryococelus australis]|uniref:PiggyBac transposable element-derived protein domain-containing protein n=1 Tax=Dryococelus australis TaxID=614101 RepID=A0ABQ9GYC8_9NEOP|nr:hypothetical protein PR048_021477 [Dryococelus australis]